MFLSTRQLLLVALANLVVAAGGKTEKLSLCGPSVSDESYSSLVFVSTLDGKISALDLAKNGEKRWTQDFDNEPLISSSIHKKELNNEGQWVRLIPSLSGSIYKFDGENLERIPISTDQLLRSSFRYSDDLIVSGSLNSQIYKVSSSTGKINYHCKENRCTNYTEGEALTDEDVIVIQRFQQTVIATEPRTGQEKWNYSSGQHEIELIPRQNRQCNDEMMKILEEIELKAIMPEGLIWAVNKTNPSVKLWSQKFDTPIVSIWRENLEETDANAKKMVELNLFDSSQWTWGTDITQSPGVYIGMFDRQLYVQENVNFRQISPLSVTNEHTVFPWRPYPAIEDAVATDGEDYHGSSLLTFEDTPKVTALSVLYNSEYINGNGFYLFTKYQHKNLHKCNHTAFSILALNGDTSSTDSSGENVKIVEETIATSIRHFWREIGVLFATVLLIYHFLAPKISGYFLPFFSGEHHVSIIRPRVIEGTPDIAKEAEEAVTMPSGAVEEFKSHYSAEFETVDYLGKGGYGVVFEVKNRIDELHYAVKRITLPNHQEARDRVLREVKALASLDHPNIVRYYHAWLECPPMGWEQSHDDMYITNMLSSSQLDSTTTNKRSNGEVCIDLPSSDRSSPDSAFEAVEQNCSSSSFIVFEASQSQGSVDTIETEESDTSDEDSGTDGVEKSKDVSESIVFKNSPRPRRKSFLLNVNEKAEKSPRMFLYIQMQLCKKLSLREWLRHPSHWQDRTRAEKYFQQIVDAVEYIHLKGLIHRDLKPSNIFCAFDGKVKVGDFGLVTGLVGGCNETCTPDNLCNGIHTACVGTHMYMAPEQMNGKFYNYKVDIYSLGIILYELMRPFGTEMERVTALSDLKKNNFPDDFAAKHPREYQLLQMMLDENPAKRPTTLGIKARPPLSHSKMTDKSTSDDKNWHFELPQIRRHSSVLSSSSSESWENSK